MADRAQGRKKSNFVAKTSVETGAFMDYFVNNYNYKISYANFVAGLGVTGSIVQEGAATGTPVLDTQGTVNNIRNLENGSGVAASLSASDGITLAHNFTVDATGTPLMLNTTASSPTFVSLVAGSGVSVTASGNTAVIAATDATHYGQVTLQDNSTDTVIAATATPVLVLGTWVVGSVGNFTGTTAGRLTYTGTATSVLSVHASITIEPVSGNNNQDLSVYLAKNGSIVATTRISAIISNGASQNLSFSSNESFATNDFIEIFVRNATSTANVTVIRAILGVD